MGTTKDTIRYAGAAVWFSFIGVIVLLIIAAMWLFSFGLFARETAGFFGDVEAAQQTEGSGAFRIAAYDHFFDLCAAVQSDEDRVLSLEAELEGDPSDSRKEQIQASLTAVRSGRAEKVRQYNADAAKDYTIGEFRDSRLPYTLDVDNWETSCVLAG